jgi:hypothetical protein
VVGNPSTGFSQSIFQWFNTAAFRTPDQFTYGNSGRNNMRGPAAKQYDFVAFKEFTLLENTKLEFRGEFFNLPNHPRFGVPGNNVQSSAFGKITSSGEPRDIQFALKLTF